MATENFTTYIELDPDSGITISADQISWSNLKSRGDLAYVYKDMGINHFAGDFEHRFQFYITRLDNYSRLEIWRISDVISAWHDPNSIYCELYNDVLHGYKLFRLGYWTESASYTEYYPLFYSTLYYVVVKRDETIGDYGTIYAYLSTGGYYDEGGSLVDTLSVPLPAKLDFQYLYGLVNTGEEASGYYTTGYVQYLDLGETSPSSLQLPTESITKNSATLKGKIVSDGGSSCEARFRYRIGLDSYSYTSWANGLNTNDIFDDAITGLTSETLYEVACQAKNPTEGVWSSSLYFMTLSERETVEVEDKITLEAIRNIEMSSKGQFYIDEEGNAVYKSRYGRRT